VSDISPAFPFFASWDDPKTSTREVHAYHGMTLRQYYAAAALTGFTPQDLFPDDQERVVRVAFRIADAMLAHEEKEQA